MSLFLILLAAGDSKRLKSNTPKPFHIVNNKTLLEHSFSAFRYFTEIKKTIIVYNKKHKKYLDKLKLNNTLKVVGGKTRQESTFKALKIIKRMNCRKVLVHDSARPNPSKDLVNKIIYNNIMYNNNIYSYSFALLFSQVWVLYRPILISQFQLIKIRAGIKRR